MLLILLLRARAATTTATNAVCERVSYTVKDGPDCCQQLTLLRATCTTAAKHDTEKTTRFGKKNHLTKTPLLTQHSPLVPAANYSNDLLC
jgi:hypothetical protein